VAAVVTTPTRRSSCGSGSGGGGGSMTLSAPPTGKAAIPFTDILRERAAGQRTDTNTNTDTGTSIESDTAATAGIAVERAVLHDDTNFSVDTLVLESQPQLQLQLQQNAPVTPRRRTSFVYERFTTVPITPTTATTTSTTISTTSSSTSHIDML
jgi:hypothetical protein